MRLLRYSSWKWLGWGSWSKSGHDSWLLINIWPLFTLSLNYQLEPPLVVHVGSCPYVPFLASQHHECPKFWCTVGKVHSLMANFQLSVLSWDWFVIELHPTLVISADRDRFCFIFSTIDAVNLLTFFLNLPPPCIELQFLKDHTALVTQNRHNFKHVPLDTHELGKLCLTHLAIVIVECVGGDSLVFSEDDTIAKPRLQTVKMHESLAAWATTRRYDEIERVTRLLTQTDSACLDGRVDLMVYPVIPSHSFLLPYSHQKSLSSQFDDISVL